MSCEESNPLANSTSSTSSRSIPSVDRPTPQPGGRELAMAQAHSQRPFPVYHGPAGRPLLPKPGYFPQLLLNRPAPRITLPPLPTLTNHGHHICPTHHCKSSPTLDDALHTHTRCLPRYLFNHLTKENKNHTACVLLKTTLSPTFCVTEHKPAYDFETDDEHAHSSYDAMAQQSMDQLIREQESRFLQGQPPPPQHSTSTGLPQQLCPTPLPHHHHHDEHHHHQRPYQADFLQQPEPLRSHKEGLAFLAT